MSVVVIENYNPLWPRLFEEEKACILATLGDYVIDVQHVGSTSVPGLSAKPIIDILVVLPNIALVERTIQPLERLDYNYRGEAGVPGRHFFRKPPAGIAYDERTHHLHMVEKDHYEHRIKLLFRDYLRAHPETARQYQELKQELAARYSMDRVGYTNAKDDFIGSILRIASEEARERGELVPDKPEGV